MTRKLTHEEASKEIINSLAPEYFLELSEEIHCIANSFVRGQISNDEMHEIAFLICKFSNRHADSLVALKKKFKGYSDVLKPYSTSGVYQ